MRKWSRVLGRHRFNCGIFAAEYAAFYAHYLQASVFVLKAIDLMQFALTWAIQKTHHCTDDYAVDNRSSPRF